MNNLPKISVITPSYNQGEFLEKTIKSVLDQNYPKLEWIVMDGGSTDSSVEILKQYEEHFTYWQSEKDDGQSAAINAGMAKATGDICCWLNSDDLFPKGTLDKVAQVFMETPEAQWLIGRGDFWDLSGKFLRDRFPVDVDKIPEWKESALCQPSTFWRRDLWEKVGGLNRQLHYSMDFDLWLRFLNESRPKTLDKVLSISQVHEDMKSLAGADEMFVEHSLVLAMNGHFDQAKVKLMRPITKIFSLDRKFGFIKKLFS